MSLFGRNSEGEGDLLSLLRRSDNVAAKGVVSEKALQLGPGIMEISRGGQGSVVSMLREKGLEEEWIEQMLKKCVRLQVADAAECAHGNWSFLEGEVLIPARKMPMVVRRCPQLLVLGVSERIFPMVNCLRELGVKETELVNLVSRFPHLLTHSVEEKLCPILSFLQAVGVKEKNLTKVILRCPRLLSYSIERKLAPAVNYLSSLGLGKEDMGRALTQSPNILGYSIETRLRPTVQYLQGLGLRHEQLQNMAIFFPHLLCRKAEQAFRPAESYLRSLGFAGHQLASIVGGFPPILTKSVKNSLEPKVHFLVNEMHLPKEELLNFPRYFGYSLHRTIGTRYKRLRAKDIQIKLDDMLGCNQKQFEARFGKRGVLNNCTAIE